MDQWIIGLLDYCLFEVRTINPIIHQSNHPSIQSSVNPIIQQSNHPAIQSSINPIIRQSNHPAIQSSIFFRVLNIYGMLKQARICEVISLRCAPE
jgi:hypothetical protein